MIRQPRVALRGCAASLTPGYDVKRLRRSRSSAFRMRNSIVPGKPNRESSAEGLGDASDGTGMSATNAPQPHPWHHFLADFHELACGLLVVWGLLRHVRSHQLWVWHSFYAEGARHSRWPQETRRTTRRKALFCAFSCLLWRSARLGRMHIVSRQTADCTARVQRRASPRCSAGPRRKTIRHVLNAGVRSRSVPRWWSTIAASPASGTGGAPSSISGVT